MLFFLCSSVFCVSVCIVIHVGCQNLVSVLGFLRVMHRAWPDPRCPMLGPDGAPPPWLVLTAFDGGGRQWYCTLCEQWAESSHLQGRRHKKNLWYFNDLGSSATLTSSVAASSAPECFPQFAIMTSLHEPVTSLSAPVGLNMQWSADSGGAAHQSSVISSGHAHQCRITSLAQIDSGVVEELLALVVAQLQLIKSG